MYAYEQSFLCLAYHCDFWHEAASYLYNQSKLGIEGYDEIQNAAGNLYERAVNTFMKNNVLIHLSYADFEEVA